MSVSTNAEMRLRRRRPSDAPEKALARVLRISARGKRRKRLLAIGGHIGTAASLGLVRGMLDRLGLRSPTAAVVLFAFAMTPDVAVVPALGASRPPWKWTRKEAGVSAFHHAVFAATTDVAYVRLHGRD